MQRILRQCQQAAWPTFLSLVAGALLSVAGFAGAAATNCPSGEGTQCFLVISAPESVATGQPFMVEVDVTTDGATIAKNDVCAATVRVTLDIYDGESTIASYTATAKKGVATFSLSIPYPGPFALYAYIGEGDGCDGYNFNDASTFLEVVDITPGQPIAPCPPGQICTQTDSGGGSAATLYSETGEFQDVFWSNLDFPGCGGTGPAEDNGVLNFDYVGTSPKFIIFWLDADVVTKKAKKYEVCWYSPDAFMPLHGTIPVNTGYLPKCGKKTPAPCVLKKKDVKKEGAYFVILAPPGDPKAYPE